MGRKIARLGFPYRLLLLLAVLYPDCEAREVHRADFETVRNRYIEWVLAGNEVNVEQPHVAARYALVNRQAQRSLKRLKDLADFEKPAGLYDTRKQGEDQREVEFLVKEALPTLAIAYQLRGQRGIKTPYYQNDSVLEVTLQCFDRLHARGFREDMLMPWKAREVEGNEFDRAIIVDFHLRTSGYALATFLLRDELRAAGKLDRSLATCREILDHDEKFGSPNALAQNADGIRIVINVALPYALAANDYERLALLTKQVDRSMVKESNAADTIKPDGLGFHHRAAYPAGYAGYAVAQAAFATWLLDGTLYACKPETIANLVHAMKVLRIISNTYDMHKALAGRLRETDVLRRILLGYGYLSALKHPRQKDCQRMLARLVNTRYLQGPHASKIFSPQRNEVFPGPGAINDFLKILSVAHRTGAELAPSGHWALNYGPLSVHRRDDWMVAVKGHSRYLWAFERSLTDARLDARLQNVLGFHDGSASLFIFANGEPVNALDSGYSEAGWDWCKIPGTTTRQIPAKQLLALDRASKGKALNRPFGPSAFAGGVQLGEQYGVFAMHYREVAPDRRRHGLSAMKALFFFDEEIVSLSTKIQNGDGIFPVGTTLYQSQLSTPEVPTWVNGTKISGLTEHQIHTGKRAMSLVDPAGNGYYIPRPGRVIVQRNRQSSLDYTGLQTTTGDFASAWFDHGPSPEQAGCEYVILVQAGVDGTQKFAREADKIYTVDQRNSRALIVRHHIKRLTGYVLPRANEFIEKGMVERVSHPCLLMTQDMPNGLLHFSVCNPDLGWKEGEQFNYRKQDGFHPPTDPVVIPITLTLRGAWQLQKPHPATRLILHENNQTSIEVQTADAQSVQFVLVENQGS